MQEDSKREDRYYDGAWSDQTCIFTTRHGTKKTIMVLTKGATFRIMEWASQKALPKQERFVEFLNEQIDLEERSGINVITGIIAESIISEFEKLNC